MKSYFLLIVFSIFIFAGCSSTKSIGEYDDVYYSTKSDQKTAATNPQVTDPDYVTKSETAVEDYETGEYVEYEEEPYYSESETVQTPEGTTYITNNYYGGYSDYYDYSYASRINRFYGSSFGFGYYSPYYMGFYYDPWYYDYYWWRPSLYFGFNWGWGSFGWGYPYYYSPYWYGGSYWAGYNHGFWDGYYAGSYYYDYGYNSYYYGHRPSRGGSNSNSGYNRSGTSGTAPANRTSRVSNLERATPELNGTASRTGTGNNSGTLGRSGGSASENTSAGPVRSRDQVSDGTKAGNPIVVQEKNRTSQNDVTKQESPSRSRYIYQKPENTQTRTNTRYQPGQTIDNNQRTVPSQRYSKPSEFTRDNVRTTQRSSAGSGENTQVYTRPKSNYNQSYSKPSRSNTSERYTQPSRSGSSTYQKPSRSSSSYSTPSRSSNTKSYSPPTRSGNNRSYSVPSRSNSSRSYSTPSRSGSSGSYSTPSKSGGSSSTPSRSGGGSSRSSGGRR
jgi:hypothetical protein